MNEQVLITAALPYANGNLHLGHIAGCYLNADIRSRFERMMGKEVLFISGSDSYGAAVLMSAAEHNETPVEIARKYNKEHKKLFEDLDIEFDIFSSTLCEEHEDTVVEFFKNLYDNSLVKERVSKQLFDPIREEFLADRFIKGTCPICKYEHARGDECTSCGKVFESISIINPKSSIFGNDLIIKDSKHFYLDIPAQKDKIKSTIDSKGWKKNVVLEAEGYLERLQDRCITRSISWGIKVPEELKSSDSDANVFYVWFDAPIGYVSITKEWCKANGRDYRDYWFNKKIRMLNFLGKDNVMFHAIMFPSMQMGAFPDMNIADEILANNFLLFNNKKFSKSDKNYLDTYALIEEFGKDSIRFYLALNAPETSDVSCDYESMKADVNKIFVGKIGNFVNRSLTFINRYISEGIYIEDSIKTSDINNKILYYSEKIKEMFGKSSVRNATALIRDFVDEMNKYFDDNKPWNLLKIGETQTLNTVMANCLIAINALSVFMMPIVPSTSKKVANMLGNFSNASDSSTWNDLLLFKSSLRVKISHVDLLVHKI
ncbi:MAG: methionine--tRNA ligase [Chlamydiia bacterium]|nr:methionine--tRNA ligase [Chlamydiia bacterium]